MKKLIHHIILISSALLFTANAYAQSEINEVDRKEQAKRHEEIAAFHTKIAACFAGNQPLSECQTMMMTACPSMHGKMRGWMNQGAGKGTKGGMMGQGMMGQGMMGQGTMGQVYGCPQKDASDAKNADTPKK